MTTKTFGAFTAELLPNDDREGVNCYVEHRATGTCNSLALLLDTGGEFDESNHTVGIGPLTLDQIEAWALANGY